MDLAPSRICDGGGLVFPTDVGKTPTDFSARLTASVQMGTSPVFAQEPETLLSRKFCRRSQCYCGERPCKDENDQVQQRAVEGLPSITCNDAEA